jgi:thymidylate synthase (FAD)
MIKATYIDHMGSDLSVVNAARVSFGKRSECEETQWLDMGPWCGDQPVVSARDAKLIGYLAKHNHISPFGHCFASFHVKAPVYVARQLVKHKFLRWNEVSRRYVDDTPAFYYPETWRGRSADKKQGSDGEAELTEYQSNLIKGAVGACLATYDNIIAAGVSPEQARSILPTGVFTEWYWSGSLDAFAAMCKLRCAPDTQYESRLVANQISEVMGKLYPVSWASLVEDSQ